MNRINVNATKGPIISQLLLFFFPILFGSFFQQLYNTADALIVGNFVGKEALAAVGGSTGSVLNLFVGLFVGIASGFSITISQYFGAKNDSAIEDCVHTSIAFSLISGFFISISGFFMANSFLKFMNVPADIFPLASIYLKVIFLGMVFALVYNMGASILRAIGDSKTPLIFLIISCFVNILLDLLFIVIFKMGVLGAALATIGSQALSMILVIIRLIKTKDSYRLIPKNIKIHSTYFKKMFTLGLATGLQSVMFTSANIMIQSSINKLGVDSIAAFAASSKIDAIFWMSMQALGISITTVTGQNYGARKKERVKKVFFISLALASLLTFIYCSLFLLFGDKLFYIFNKDKEVINIGIKILTFFSFSFPLYIIIEVYSSILRASSDVWIPMLITALSICIVRIVWILIVFPLYPNINTISFSYTLSWACNSILFLIYMHGFSKLWKWMYEK